MFLTPPSAGVGERTLEFCMKSFQNVTPVLRNYSRGYGGRRLSVNQFKTNPHIQRSSVPRFCFLFPFLISPLFIQDILAIIIQNGPAVLREWRVFLPEAMLFVNTPGSHPRWSHAGHCTTRRKDKEVEGAAGMLVKRGRPLVRQVCRSCAFFSLFFFFPNMQRRRRSSKHRCVCNESEWPRHGISGLAGDVYQPRAPRPQSAAAVQLCRSVSQTHRLPFRPRLHPAHNSASVLQSSTFNKAHCGLAYHKPELIKPCL